MQDATTDRLATAARVVFQKPTADGRGGASFDSIYATYLPLLRNIAVRKFGVPRDEAETLAHDVFTTYLANPTNVRELHPYLIGAICNAARQFCRRNASERAIFCEGEVCHATPPNDLVDGVIRALVVRKTLSHLGDSCRETLRRFYLLGETAPAIAAARKTSANYILRLLHYCRKRARALYDQMQRGS